MIKKTINITGHTQNVNGHAALVADNIGTYLIHGMDRWQDKWLNKKVKIIGDLKINKKDKSKLIEHPVVQLL